MVWSMLQRSAAGPDGTIDLGKIDPRMREFSRQRAERDGSIPLPDSGLMTKAQYLDHFARSEAAKAARAAGGPALGGPPMTITLSAPGGPPAGGPPGGFGGPPGGFNPDDRGSQRLKEQDRDGDGRVAFAEADDRLKQNFQQIDRNGDGFVDGDEYRGYYANRDRDRGGDRGGFGGPPGGFNGGNWGDPNNGFGRKDEKKDTAEPKPVAMRYGFLPKDLPEWYDKYDADKDGQVALHEWRKSGDEIAKFLEMDLNGDGLVTADELLRFNFKQAEDARIAAINGEGGAFPSTAGRSVASRGTGGFSLPGSTPPSTDKVSATSDKPAGGPPPGKGWNRDEKGDKGDKGDRPNPFRDGGFKKK
ncbi:hypothetical protein : : EF-hand_5: EF-hand_5 [Gemmataceae bacterium]|nr:hypothetical protein : : EF-hand_5: EF-hand_5 [Gemmataceae bacterium]VTT97052.1 hypothetical protein : : EF-hand_5: EF-hand_5 [Gemmataceae bacterium]